MTLEIELLHTPTQVETLRVSKFGSIVLCGGKKKRLVLDYSCPHLFQRSRKQLASKPHPAWFGPSALLWINPIEERNLWEDSL